MFANRKSVIKLLNYASPKSYNRWVRKIKTNNASKWLLQKEESIC